MEQAYIDYVKFAQDAGVLCKKGDEVYIGSDFDPHIILTGHPHVNDPMPPRRPQVVGAGNGGNGCRVFFPLPYVKDSERARKEMQK